MTNPASSSTPKSTEDRIFDVIVVGGGHAGCEAALAASRLGADTLLLTLSLDTLAAMSCNPAIGGLAKGQLVRELDAMGGQMGLTIDRTGIQFRMLNTNKGPAVQSPRAQADKHLYHVEMRRVLEETDGLTLAEGACEEFIIENGSIRGVVLAGGQVCRGRTVIITTGTFLRGLMHTGSKTKAGGRAGEATFSGISTSLQRLGFELLRLKTGTPPRLFQDSIDFGRCQEQLGDADPVPFSYRTVGKFCPEQTPCYITYTNPDTHSVIRENLDRSPLYTGQISGAGPRYCPSIEDKVVKFAERDRHQIFLEPESLSSDWIYVNGISTSLPQDVQDAFVHSIPGLEKARFARYGYAVEYDFLPPHQIYPHLETKRISGLFLAGQINGTSGYEEAAVQGFMAGINAVLKVRDESPFVLDRSEAYIGVLMDDLVNSCPREPYRMFTSRAEFRLLLRHDNADRRLMKYGRNFGLISAECYAGLQEKEVHIEKTLAFLSEKFSAEGRSLLRVLRRPEMNFASLSEHYPELLSVSRYPEVSQQVEIEAKYQGYIERQQAHVTKFKQMEGVSIPADFDYSMITHMKTEALEVLKRVRPLSLGQASRIAGVTPADISILMMHLLRPSNEKKVSR